MIILVLHTIVIIVILNFLCFLSVAEGDLFEPTVLARAFEAEARKDQGEKIPIGKEMIRLMDEFEKEETKEAILAKDADVLEQLLQEKEYYEIGNEQALLWMEYSFSRLKSESAKGIAKAVMAGSVKDWWWDLQDKPAIKDGKPKFYGKKIKG